MLRSLLMLGAGWFIYTKEGRKVFVNICKNSIPYLEKELNVNITKPIAELTKDPEQKKETEE